MKKKYYLIIGFVFIIIIALVLGTLTGFFLAKKGLKGGSLEYVALGHKYFREKDFINSIIYFNRAIALDPNSFLASISLADAYYAVGYLELSLAEYEIALSMSQKSGNYPNEKKYINTRILEIKKKLAK
jgi:Tfp pilus assembly protein PilF